MSAADPVRVQETVWVAVAAPDLAEAQVVWALDSWRSLQCRFHTVLVR